MSNQTEGEHSHTWRFTVDGALVTDSTTGLVTAFITTETAERVTERLNAGDYPPENFAWLPEKEWGS